MQGQRDVVGLVGIQRAEISRAGVGVDEVLEGAARLDRLVAVDEGDDLDSLATVVITAQANPCPKHAVRTADICLILPVVRGDPIVSNRVADVRTAAQVT